MITEKMMENLKFTAIRRLDPEIEFNISSNGDVEFLDKTKMYSQSTIEAEIDKIREEYKNTNYQLNRKKEYDNLNQFELLYNDKKNGTDTWSETILEIKKKYPKPS
jgi:hypothetical protein